MVNKIHRHTVSLHSDHNILLNVLMIFKLPVDHQIVLVFILFTVRWCEPLEIALFRYPLPLELSVAAPLYENAQYLVK